MNADLTNIVRTKLIHQGKANNVWETNCEEFLELEASDRISAGNGAKTDIIEGKGVANNLISKAIFADLEYRGIPTHYVGPGSNAASKVVKKAQPILLEVIGRFYATGSYAKRYDVKDMTPFADLFVEYTYKSDNSGDPPISEDAIVAKGIATRRELGFIEYTTERVAYAIKEFFNQCGGNLIDFKIEFGRLPNGSIVVIDEISPDTCRIKDKATGQSLDKDRFRKDLGKVAETYAEMARRVKTAEN